MGNDMQGRLGGRLTGRAAWRWTVPALVAALTVGVIAGWRVLVADASPTLPPRTAAQLLVDLQNAHIDAFSGTVVKKADLGLPALPTIGGQSPVDLQSLVSGTHTLRVWYAGPQRQRLALLDTLGETDIIHNGRDLWTWSSRDNTATHRVLPPEAASAPTPQALASALPVTPDEAARRALERLEPTTRLSTDGTARVAGRSAYELVLQPKDAASRVAAVRLAVDAQERIPLRVRVFARGVADPVYEIGFTRISFTTPPDAQFRFTPPPGAKVERLSASRDSAESKLSAVPEPFASKQPGGSRHMPQKRAVPPSEPQREGSGWQVVGRGWSAVLVAPAASGPLPREVAGFVESLPRVSGSWGSGRLLESRLFSALLTDDGRLLVGAVDPERLYKVAAVAAR
jgi:outer membrane lipoprotein-sorting protein